MSALQLALIAPPPVSDGSLRPDELIVDLFAGGGGASTGILAATGRHPDIAVNHSAAALALHEANHPSTRHFREYEFDVVAMLEDATLRVAKSRCSALAGYFARDPGPEFATLLSAWLAGAESAAPSVDDAVDEELIDRLASMSQTERRDAYMSASAATQAAMKAWQQRQREAV